MMTSTIYVCLAAFWFVFLSVQVITTRRRLQVRIGDGGQAELIAKQRIQGNAAEYLPLALILLVLFDLNRGAVWLVHLFGLAILAGRVIHARALTMDHLPTRVKGMMITFAAIIGLAVANLISLL